MDKVFTKNLSEILPENTKKIAVAVSGGADSFALLHLTHLWAKKNKTTLLALTVDHKLRKESAVEAQTVAAWCKENRIAHKTLNWTGVKPKTDIQNKARDARRKLLFAACKKEKTSIILMGHQADDQAETVLMRLQRGTGLRGLVGIRPSSQEGGITILRPLLSHSRAELRQYCKKHKLPFHDDPSNDNAAFERVRMRKILVDLPDLATGIKTAMQRLDQADRALQKIAADWYVGHVHDNWFPQEKFLHLPDELQLRVLGKMIADASLDGLERLQKAITANEFKGQTLADFWIKPKVKNRKKGLIFTKAPARRGGKKE